MKNLTWRPNLPPLDFFEDEFLQDWELEEAILNPIFIASPVRNSPVLTPGESVVDIEDKVEVSHEDEPLESIAPSRPMTPSPRR